MSSLYLVLRRRLEEVLEWVELDTATMNSARRAKGLSYEAVARLLNVSSKTYERYEKAGRVPRWMLPAVAAALDLEIEQAEPRRIRIDDEVDEAEQLARLDDRVGRVEEELATARGLLAAIALAVGAEVAVPPDAEHQRVS
jgi:transcriptional regulator with XRE-family HTH domain